MDPSHLLFVHKSSVSKSLSHSSDHERQEIYRHVQLDRTRKRQTKMFSDRRSLPFLFRSNTDPQHSQSDAQQNIRRTVSDISGPIVSSNAQSDWDLSLRHAVVEGSEPDLGTEEAAEICNTPLKAQERQQPDDDVVPIAATEPKITASLIRRNSTDPFHVSATPLNEDTVMFIQYFQHVSNPRTWYPKWPTAQSRIRNQETSSLVVRSCFDCEMSMLTMLAAMASQMQYLEAAAPLGDSARFIQRATVAIRRYVEDCSRIDERLLFVIILLAFAEFHQFDTRAARVHLKAVQMFIAQLGGIEALSPHLRWWAITADDVLMAEPFPQKPLFPLEGVGANSSGAGSGFNPVSESRLVLGAPRVIDTAKIPSVLQSVVEDLIESLPQIEYCFSELNGASGKMAERTKRWMHTKLWVIRTGLLALQIPDPFTDAIRFAVLVWMYMMASVGRRRMMMVHAMRLKTLLTSAGRQIWVQHSDLHRWVLITGALGSGSNSGERRWFTCEFVEVYPERVFVPGEGFLSERNVADMLSCVLYLEAAQRSILPGLVRDFVDVASSRQGNS